HSLGIPRWANEIVLTVAGAMIGVSGTAARTMHIVHHARPGATDDFEGRTLHGSLGRALIVSPCSYFELPFRAFARSLSTMRRRQVFGWALVLALFGAALIAGGRARLYAEVCVIAQLTIQIWAARLPHRAPRALLDTARFLVWTRAPLVLSFVFHDLHHQEPH